MYRARKARLPPVFAIPCALSGEGDLQSRRTRLDPCLVLSQKPYQCPPWLLEMAAARPAVRTAVAAAAAPLPIVSAMAAAEQGLIEPVLVGDAASIRRIAEEVDWPLEAAEIVDVENPEKAAERAAEIAGAGEAGALMKGHIHTDAFMKAVLRRESGLCTDRRLTHIFHMSVPDRERTLLISDAAINVKPEPETMMHIIRNAVALAHALGNEEPRVALLSATEDAIDSMPSSVVAAALAERAKTEVPGALVHGPLAFDNAVSPEAAEIKNIDHPVAGNADILIVPDIETGNALFKMMVYFMSACAAGIVAGAKVPIVLTSRADPTEARLAAAAIAAIVADAS